MTANFPSNGTMVVDGDYTYSMENAGVLTAQYLVLGVQPTEYAALLANPVVKQLPAVKAGRVIVTEGGSEGFGNDGFVIAGAIGQYNALPGIQKAFTTTGQQP
ncbi:MAG: hypothetical protein ACRDJU_00475 [Actinomycetota bacterium]